MPAAGSSRGVDRAADPADGDGRRRVAASGGVPLAVAGRVDAAGQRDDADGRDDAVADVRRGHADGRPTVTVGIDADADDRAATTVAPTTTPADCRATTAGADARATSASAPTSSANGTGSATSSWS